MAIHSQSTKAAIRHGIRYREDFKSPKTLTGVTTPIPGFVGDIGELPRDWSRIIRDHTPDYIVYSYETPIAWHSAAHGWVVPSVRYSVTTTGHQGQVRIAITESGHTYRESL